MIFFYYSANNIDLTKHCSVKLTLIKQCIGCSKRHSKCNSSDLCS